jgi:periplasmic protein TonB
MSRLSIFETQWIDLVFEHRNKEYGAYQLRQESAKTTTLALFVSVSMLLSIYAIISIISYFNPNADIITDIPKPTVVITDLTIIPPKVEPPKEKMTPPASQKSNTPKTQFVPMVPADRDEATTEVPVNTDIIDSGSTTTTGPTGSTPDGTGISPEPAAPAPDNRPYSNDELDKSPQFPGGIKKFLTYVATNFKSAEDLESNIKVTVSFVVERDGTMSNIKVINNPGYGMGDEAIRVLKSMKTKWEPGVMNGEKVRTSYVLPITIQI